MSATCISFHASAKPVASVHLGNPMVTRGVRNAIMAYDPGAIDATLAAAVGDDPGLIAELRLALVDSAERAIAAMTEASPETWVSSAWRLRGLAASFGAVRLMALATEAATAGTPNPVLLGRLGRAVQRL